MTDTIEAAPAEETAAFAAMQKGEDQPGSEQLPKPDTSVETVEPAAEPGSKETDPPPVAVEPQNKVVPIQALDAERDKRKAANAAAQLDRASRDDALARLKQIQEMQRSLGLPNVDEDPVAATKAVVEIFQQQRNEQVTLHQAQEILALSSQHEAAYAREFPEYNAAVSYLHQQVVQEMMAFEGLTQNQANARAAVAASRIAERAMASGINPAIPMLQLAQLRGWRPEAPAAVQAAPNPAPAAVATPSAAEQLLAQSAKTLETIAAGQQAARSGAGMRGGADTPPSLREIAELSNSDDPADIKRVEDFWKAGAVKRAMG